MQFYNERAFGVGHRMQTHTQACSKRKPPALAAGGLTTARFNEDQLEPLKSTLATWLKPDITRSSAVVVTAGAHSLPGSNRLCRHQVWMTEVRTSVSSSLSGNVRTCISAPHNDPRHRIVDPCPTSGATPHFTLARQGGHQKYAAIMTLKVCNGLIVYSVFCDPLRTVACLKASVGDASS